MYTFTRTANELVRFFYCCLSDAAAIFKAPSNVSFPPMKPLLCTNTQFGIPATWSSSAPLKPRHASGRGSLWRMKLRVKDERRFVLCVCVYIPVLKRIVVYRNCLCVCVCVCVCVYVYSMQICLKIADRS